VLSAHVIPGRVFDTLASGRGGRAAALYLVGAERSKHLLLLRGVVDASARYAHPRAAEVRRAYDALCRIEQCHRRAVDAVVRQPAIAAWASQTLRALAEGDPGQAAPELMAAVAAAAAIHAREPFTADLSAHAGAVLIPSLGRALFPGASRATEARIVVSKAGTAITAGGDRVRLPPDPRRDAEGWQCMRRLIVDAGDLRLDLLLDDIDPYRFAAMPDTADRLSPEELASLRATLARGWQLLARRHRQVAEEVRTMVCALTPLAPAHGGQANATSGDTFGCIALSPERSPQSLALALAHEVQHLKLAALLDLVVLVRPGSSELHYAPWREDPRPLLAMLHGAYAFLGVAGFWEEERRAEVGEPTLEAHTEFARWRDATAEAVEAMAGSSDLTGLGRRFVDGMKRTLATWRRQRVPSSAAETARIAAERHRLRWRHDDGT
jgi:HEXXH motif-containing protein